MLGTDGDSREYWSYVADAHGCDIAEAMDAYGYEPPEPYPANRRAWGAFLRVFGCVHVGFGLPQPNWADIRAVLELHDLWDADTQERLVICFQEVRAIAAEAREERSG